MRGTVLFRTALLGALAIFALASAANAATGRTWVSSTGVDSGACGRTAPCATFQFAYNNTTAGGEIIALDTTGYGPLTATHAITVTGLEPALVAVQSNTTGITISAGASDVVTLRNIQIVGAPGNSNTVGIRVNTGKVNVLDSALRNLTDGLVMESTGNGDSVIRANFSNTDFLVNTRAITTNGQGVNTQTGNPPHTGKIIVRIAGGDIIGNGTVHVMTNPGNTSGNNWYPVWVFAPNNTIVSNIIANTVVASGTPTGSGQDCQFGCTGLTTYTSQVGPNNEPGP